jgi:hypothetical protein
MHVPDHPESNLTWAQRRELELELWLEDHLRALTDVASEDLDEAGTLAAIESRARMLSEVAGRLRRLRGEDLREEMDVAVFRLQLDDLG